MLGIGDREGLNDSAHCRSSPRLKPSLDSPVDAESVAGVKSPNDEAEGGPSDAQEGSVGSIEDMAVLGVAARLLLLELYERHISLVRSNISLAIEVYALLYRSLRRRDSCTMKLAKSSRRSSSVAADISFSTKARCLSMACNANVSSLGDALIEALVGGLAGLSGAGIVEESSFGVFNRCEMGLSLEALPGGLIYRPEVAACLPVAGVYGGVIMVPESFFACAESIPGLGADDGAA